MTDVLYLAWRYLRFNAWRTALLTGAITLILALPAALHVLVGQAAGTLTDRAERTPILVGAQGSPVDLVLSALYFRTPTVTPIAYRQVEELAAARLGTAIPLHLRFTTASRRIVGTTPEYFAFRALEVRDGRPFAILGEAVVGARAAVDLGVDVGDAVVSTPAGAFDVAGAFPLRMRVVGILAPTRSPDDDAVFVDLKTAWVIEGIGHGHDEVAGQGTDTPPGGEEGAVAADPLLLPYTEITPENLASFHFHGDVGSYPVDAVVMVPAGAREGVVLRGRYPEGEGPVQAIVPLAVVDGLVETMFSVRNAALLVSAGLAVATIATCGLVFALTFRLRRGELETMRRIGAPSGTLRAILSVEAGTVVAAAALLAACLTLLVARFGDAALRLAVG